MPSSTPDPKPSAVPAPEKQGGVHPAEQHVQDAHTLLTSLRQKVEHHPELEEAIAKLEAALRVLTVKTGGML